MRTFDLSPLYRSTIGFDRLFSMLDQAAGVDNAPTYPPYNIERTDEHAYRISIAVAGFGEGELQLEARENLLTVRGDKQAAETGAKPQAQVLHQGIASRAFERRFQLADHVTVTGAVLEHGLLHIDLVREVPEAKKPRSIPISTSSGATLIENAEAPAKPEAVRKAA